MLPSLLTVSSFGGAVVLQLAFLLAELAMVF